MTSGYRPTRGSRPAGHVAEKLPDSALQLPPVNDGIEHPVVEQELGGLKTLRKVLTQRLLDHTRARESDDRTGLGEDRVAEHREARADATSRRISENRDVWD